MKPPKELSPEVAAIQQDLTSLKNNTVVLAQRVKEEGARRASALGDESVKLYERAKEQGMEGLRKAEDSVRDNPLRGVAIAFASGFLASLLLRRK